MHLPIAGDVLRDSSYITRVASRIRRIDGSHTMSAAELVSTLVAEFRDPIITENFEGIAVREGRNGNAIVYIISDDNFSPLQRTLLMMFELKN